MIQIKPKKKVDKHFKMNKSNTNENIKQKHENENFHNKLRSKMNLVLFLLIELKRGDKDHRS